MGQSVSTAGADGRRPPSSRSATNARVITDDGRDVDAGLGRDRPGRGRRATSPVGYYKDPEKSAATFLDHRRRALLDPRRLRHGRGRRHASRCSAAARCASTPAARRSSPRRSRRSLKTHPTVRDAVVVGVPDEQFGEAITAVVELAPGADARRGRRSSPTSRASSPPTRRRSGCVADRHDRPGPNGKVDYKRLKGYAADQLGVPSRASPSTSAGLIGRPDLRLILPD